MQPFKKIVFSALLGGMLSSNVNAQKELIISGGNSVSSFVCANRKAFTWGNNTNALGTGLLGNGSSSAIVNHPTAVAIPGNLDIQQINSGSGSHFLALTCEATPGMGGGIFAWGNNEFGQVGNNTKGNIVNTPTRVKLGILSTQAALYDPENTGNITAGIVVVYAGNSSSYAITISGELIAWGLNTIGTDLQNYDNASGMLGDGTTISKLTPVFVKTANGANLSGVTQVYASDNVTYALVDPDGDGVGTVYSWGNGLNGALARNAAGTANPISSATVQDSYARPVFYGGSGGGNGQMNNIVTISAGDVFGIALDDKGYVWTWGNGSWNNATGNTTSNYTGSDPKRVIAGNSTGSSNDGTYLLAKSISGGQGYGMAVTIDGKPVAWGGNTLDCTSGGITGTGATASGIAPSYIKSSTIVHNDVIAIFRGDTWGYYQRADGSIYAWGCNIYGQLGIGNTTNQTTAVAFTPPSGCILPDPKPTVHLTPQNITTCASKLTTSPVILNSGFVISASLATNYTVTWKNGNSIVKTGTATAANLTYSANSTGTYSVTIKYVGANSGCIAFDDATASITISAYAKNFTTPSTNTYCGSTSIINVNSTEVNNPVYKFYPTAASSTVLGTTIGSGSTTIDLSTATTSGTDKIVYVEQASLSSGILFKKTQACDTTWGSFENIINSTPMNQSGFTTYSSNITINSVSVQLKSDIFVQNTPLTAIINFGIYGAKISNGIPIADDTKLIGSFVYNFSKTITAQNNSTTIETVKIPVNISLPNAGIYFISLKNNALSNSTGPGLISIGRGQCIQPLPISGTPTGYISFTNNSSGFQFVNAKANQSNFFNIEFSTGQGYCDRLPITFTEDRKSVV